MERALRVSCGRGSIEIGSALFILQNAWRILERKGYAPLPAGRKIVRLKPCGARSKKARVMRNTQTMKHVGLIKKTARHEAGHAVMRKILGLSLTAISVDFASPGNGLCHGTGQKISGQDYLLFALAGVAVECHYMPFIIDWEKAATADLDEAKEILETNKMLCGINVDTMDFFSPDEALKKWLSRAAEMLHPYKKDINRLAKEAIASGGELNPEAVANLLASVEVRFPN